ncbi:GDSL-like Lipase/Acylhydrolase [Phytophthora megakarya]|uniref:GDSL-like Lipase/Acylhydrolase n=1 Tax=Phytophthora megakarya TaxID=4795 RepID=A0A225WB22_9STRA|nr:GDSL-like Lipase/Acylhydrolase [Phytophthora megakarya]
MKKPRQQNHYTVEQWREVLERVAVDGCKPTARVLNILLGTLKGWRKKAKLPFEFK